MKPVTAIIEALPSHLEAAGVSTYDTSPLDDRDVGSIHATKPVGRTHSGGTCTKNDDVRLTHRVHASNRSLQEAGAGCR
jgi:hypothetical protein